MQVCEAVPKSFPSPFPQLYAGAQPGHQSLYKGSQATLKRSQGWEPWEQEPQASDL